MKTANAARIHNYGGPETVRVERLSLPEPQSGELLIHVHAAGVNPIDWKIRAGYLEQMMPLPLPLTLGTDFSGVVEAVGDGTAGFRVGDEVYGQAAVFTGGSGSFADYLIANAITSALKPKSTNHTEAAALPLAGVSALQALVENLRISKGQKVLIHGGAGGVGSIAIQLCKHLGAHVATTATAQGIDFVKRIGADEVINYRNLRFDQVLSAQDAVLDTVGGDTYVRSFRVLKRGGRLVSLLEQPRQDLIDEFGVEAISQFTQVTTQRLQQLAKLVDEGAVHVHIDKTFPLQDSAAALRRLETESTQGKVVLKIA